MESLAFLVVVILVLIVGGGAVGVWLSGSANVPLRVVGLVLALVSAVLGLQLLSVGSLGGRLLGLAGVAAGLFSVYRAYRAFRR